MAIISVGAWNKFGHPAPEIVRRYRDAGALVLDTGRDGAIIVETDGRAVSVRTAGGRQVRYQVGPEPCVPLP